MHAPDQAVITHLNAILRNKLTGINQYFLHARMLKHIGELKLADFCYKCSIDAMKISDMLVEHVLSIGGAPNMQDLGALAIGATPEAMVANDRCHAEGTLALIQSAAAYCAGKDLKTTSELLKRIEESQQEHVQLLCALLPYAPQPIKDCA